MNALDIFHRLSEQLLEKRRDDLELFLKRVIDIPELRECQEVIDFLQSPYWVTN